MSEPDMQKTQWAEMKPDVYGGDGDEHIPQWEACAEGDMESETSSDPLIFDPKSFPAGTIITVEEPYCSECHSACSDCCCGFDWKAWADDKYQ